MEALPFMIIQKITIVNQFSEAFPTFVPYCILVFISIN